MKFGSRECTDIVFKTTAPNQKIGKTVFAKKYTPCFYIDTARTSTLEQQTSTVYAQGGRGFNRLIAWEGEKTVTFTVEDALISPLGLSILTNAGLSNADATNLKHVHISLDTNTDATGTVEIDLASLQEETGLNTVNTFNVCSHTKTPFNAMLTDSTGGIIGFVQSDAITVGQTTPGTLSDTYLVNENTTAKINLGASNANKSVKLDFYVVMQNGVFEITVRPQDFGGYFYIEAETLFRREDTGEDMAASVIIPRAKVQSAMNITMAPNGDPSTYTFTLDAFPAYTMFDKKHKVMFAMQVIGEDRTDATEDQTHEHKVPTPTTKSWVNGDVVTAQADEPASPTSGDYWFDTDVDTLYQYNGTAFVAATDVTIVDSEPDASGYNAGDKIYVKNAANIRVCQES